MTSVVPPICAGCKHLTTDLMESKCDAFPAGIPWEILLSKADHRKPFAGDSGIQFEPRTPKDAEYAAMIFDTAEPTAV
jgi:hypothetical protein